MAEIVIAPLGIDAVEMGTIFDDSGQRFCAMCFRMPGHDDVIVTMPIPLFAQFAKQAMKTAKLASTRDHWKNHAHRPR
ncbi:MAG: hypothetical protein U5M50_02145 [Sphingobium sp.]|nr:hypothetical protein [Sphingobium sp.]